MEICAARAGAVALYAQLRCRTNYQHTAQHTRATNQHRFLFSFFFVILKSIALQKRFCFCKNGIKTIEMAENNKPTPFLV